MKIEKKKKKKGGENLEQLNLNVNKWIVQLYCHCVEKFAYWLVIYIKNNNKKQKQKYNINNSMNHGAKNCWNGKIHAPTYQPTRPHSYSSGSPIT